MDTMMESKFSLVSALTYASTGAAIRLPVTVAAGTERRRCPLRRARKGGSGVEGAVAALLRIR